MQLTLQPNIPPLSPSIKYTDKLLLIGSCFTEHISGRLANRKFRVMQNPHGILFNPQSVAAGLEAYVGNEPYDGNSLFFLNELWHSWDHHSQFSGMDKARVTNDINQSQQEAHAFIKEADWVMITLGSAFQYYLKDGDRPVANNHRAQAQLFHKKLLGIAAITSGLQAALDKLFALNAQVQVLFTISPVRHVRDGITENNRSKARLIESVHQLCDENARCHYFPAYEIVIDILRDYRFFDIDFAHPNYLATEYVWEQFVKACIDKKAVPLMEEVKDIMTAKSHRPRFPGTEEHWKFLASYIGKTEALAIKYPHLDFGEELRYFRESLKRLIMALFNFERTRIAGGFLKPSIITYTVTDAIGSIYGRLIINGRNARIEGPASLQSFYLQKGFWGRLWHFTDDMKRPFLRLSQGWQTKVTLQDERTFQLKLYRKWWIFHTRNIPGSLQAVVMERNEPVFTLDNLAKRSWSSNEANGFMQGAIHTDLTDFTIIAAFLLATQSRIEAETRAAA